MTEHATLAPSYRRDISAIVRRAFAEPGPVRRLEVGSGPLTTRVKQVSDTGIQVAHGGDSLRLRGGTDDASPAARVVEPEVYWPLTLPHRVLVLGPLLDLASSGLPQARIASVEKHVLGAYQRTYESLPLPVDLLRLLGNHAAGADDILPWLEEGLRSLMSASTLARLLRIRADLRLEVLRRLASWSWSEDAACAAELTIEVGVLCAAVAMDVQTAQSLADSHHGSVALAIQDMERRQELKFEEVLPALTRSAVAAEEIGEEERPWIVMLADARTPVWEEGLLAGPGSRATGADDDLATHTHISVPTSSPANPANANLPEESEGSPAESFRELVIELERRIVGRPQLCLDLALSGTAHLVGVQGQRLLLCGPTGSGKTHAAVALAESINRPHLVISVGDLTTTGFRGADINDLVAALDSQSTPTGPGVLVLDEIDKARLIPEASGNSYSAQNGLIVSLLGLLDGRAVTPDDSHGDQVETASILIVGTGAFDDRYTRRPPTTDDLVAWGWTPEFAARWGQRLCLSAVSRREAFDLLRRSDRSPGRRLEPLLTALDLRVHLPDALVWYAVDRWMAIGCDYRTAAEWLLHATRARIVEHLRSGGEAGATLELAPDDLPHIPVAPARDV